MEAIYERITALRIVPVIAIEDVAAALPLADALAEGGLPIAEITFRTQAAANVIERIARGRPDILVGAGTILTADDIAAKRWNQIRDNCRNAVAVVDKLKSLATTAH
ncbi:MAG: hypothetical protein ABSF71_23000 [Terriglobia bacterium]|jgi:2-dehydro-3-deoxyphosphogluconate aldolase/(4S)-4-hydroxy-2-oxoglutarate aldolase